MNKKNKKTILLVLMIVLTVFVWACALPPGKSYSTFEEFKEELGNDKIMIIPNLDKYSKENGVYCSGHYLWPKNHTSYDITFDVSNTNDVPNTNQRVVVSCKKIDPKENNPNSKFEANANFFGVDVNESYRDQSKANVEILNYPEGTFAYGSDCSFILNDCLYKIAFRSAVFPKDLINISKEEVIEQVKMETHEIMKSIIDISKESEK